MGRQEAKSGSGVFLTAEWRDLAMLNYEVDPALLQSLVPRGTELDGWNGKTFVSLVGFRFLKTKVRGIPIPFHRNFEGVNLRFYVRRREGTEIRRGVVFVREIVPRALIAAVARTVYNEPYVALPMSHEISRHGPVSAVEYAWQFKGQTNRIRLTTNPDPVLPGAGSQEQFITEHYWGYSGQKGGPCIEYQVEHPPWRVWGSSDAMFEGDMQELYGRELNAVLMNRPTSAFMAEGSPVVVRTGRRLQTRA